MATLYFLKNNSAVQMLGLVLVTDTKTVVIDGGTVEDAPALLPYIAKHGRTHVDAWYFTHPHHDHIGAFVALCAAHPTLTVDRIFCCFPTVEARLSSAPRNAREVTLWTAMDALLADRFASALCIPQELSREVYGEVTVTVVRTYSERITDDLINNSSMVLRIDGPTKSALILGDLGEAGGDDVLRRFPIALLQTDYTQMAHHGQNGVRRDFYEAVSPRACLWPSPDWLWNNDEGRGFDTGRYHTVRTREWMDALGVHEHYVEKDGPHAIEL